MFRKKEVKKSNVQLVDDENTLKEDKHLTIISQSKGIQKQKTKGVSVKELSNYQQIKRDVAQRGISLEEQAGLINIQYTKSINQQEKTESLQDKYVQEKIQKYFLGDTSYIQEAPKETKDENEEILDAIQDIQRKYLNKQDQDQAVWVGGIMEVNLSLEEKAQKIAQMEEIKRTEYFKSLITGQVYKKKIQIPPRKSQQEKDEEIQDKFLKEISDRFYHRGRIYKHAIYTKNQDNTFVESYVDEPNRDKEKILNEQKQVEQ